MIAAVNFLYMHRHKLLDGLFIGLTSYSAYFISKKYEKKFPDNYRKYKIFIHAIGILLTLSIGYSWISRQASREFLKHLNSLIQSVRIILGKNKKLKNVVNEKRPQEIENLLLELDKKLNKAYQNLSELQLLGDETTITAFSQNDPAFKELVRILENEIHGLESQIASIHHTSDNVILKKLKLKGFKKKDLLNKEIFALLSLLALLMSLLASFPWLIDQIQALIKLIKHYIIEEKRILVPVEYN